MYINIFCCCDCFRYYSLRTTRKDSQSINQPKQQSITLYSLTGTMQIDATDVDEYLANGWYTEPVVTMYATDGRTKVNYSQVSRHKKVQFF